MDVRYQDFPELAKRFGGCKLGHQGFMRFAKIIILALALAAFGDDDPFTGVLKLNPAKSKLPPTVPKSGTLRIEGDKDNIHLSVEGTTDKGEPFKLSVSCGFDAKYYGVLDSPYVDTVWFRRLNDHSIISRFLKSGAEIESGAAVVSNNGKTLRIDFSVTEARGKATKATAVLDKQ